MPSSCNCGFLCTNTKAAQVSTNKIIQGACRVPSSLFTMTRASMNVANSTVVKGEKHGSYARYLARLKGKGPLLTQPSSMFINPVQGNKTRMIGLMPRCECVSD